MSRFSCRSRSTLRGLKCALGEVSDGVLYAAMIGQFLQTRKVKQQMATTWFIQRDETTVGPLSGQQLKELALSGKLRGDDLVRKGEDGQFMPASGIKNLFADDTNNSRPVPPPLPSAESQLESSATTTPDLSSDASLLFDSDMMLPPTSSGLPSSASSWLNRLLPYWTASQKSLKDFGHQASQAGELGKLYALQTRIQQIQLPQAYTALGVDVYGERRFADAFPTLFSEIDEVVSQQSALATPSSPERKSDDLKGKVKGAAEGVLRRGKGAKLGLKLRSLQSKLGEAAYVKHGKECGPLQLVAPIKSAQEELERLKKRIDGLAAANTGKVLTPKRLLIGGSIVAFVVLIGLLPPAVQQAREAEKKAQAEHQSEKNRNRSALTADVPVTTDTLSSAASDSSASTKSTEAGTFMEQISSLQGVPMNTPLPSRQFDKHQGYFQSPRYYYKVSNQVGYDEWVAAFGQPFGVKKAPHGEHEWQQTFQGRVVYLSGWLKTPIHDKRIKNDKPMVILNAVSVD